MWPETVLVVHNRYQQAGGEEQVYEAEASLLEAHGHRVLRLEADNREVDALGRWALAARTIWSSAAAKDVRQTVVSEGVDVVHFHNTLPLISPAAHRAAAEAGAVVVQTLHNYRLVCPRGMLLRNGRPCRDCVGRAVAWPGVVHACYRNSRTASGAVAAMLTTHWALGTWTERVHGYIALTGFARDQFIQGGLPAWRVSVKGPFVDPDPGPGTHAGDYFLFVGRLSPEKGIGLLLDAWQRLERPIPLRIVGDGPLADDVRRVADAFPHVQWLGRQPSGRVRELMGAARALVFPSTWYEGFPLVIVEAFAVGLPVIAGRLGAMAEVIEHDGNGLLVAPVDPGALARAVQRLDGDETRRARLGGNARRAFESSYGAQHNYERLLAIYRRFGRHTDTGMERHRGTW